MEMKFSRGVNEEHVVKLDSKLVAVQWKIGVAYAGQAAPFEIRTACVGNQAPVKVTGKSVKGTKLGKKSGVIRSNQFNGSFDIPEDIEPGDEIYLEVKLKKNSLDGESLPIPVRPQVTASNLKWDKDKVERGQLVEMSADVRGLAEGETAGVRVYEHDSDGAHFPVTDLEGTVRDGKLKLKWVFEYFDNTEDIPDDEEMKPRDRKYQQPKYFFTVKAGTKEFGKEDQASGLTEFEDKAVFKFIDEDGLPLADHDFTATLSDGKKQDGKTDAEGIARLTNLPPGRFEVDFPGAGRFMLEPEDAQ